MAWPNFSELTFAFAYLRELEALKGAYTDLPDFITPAAEAKKGYDASVAQGGIITFLQFKRSEVMTRSSAKELATGTFTSGPVYRMHLHKHAHFSQHAALQRLETQGFPVLYVTSAAQNRSELLKQARTHSVLSSSATFKPSEIRLPNTTEDHHVSFKSSTTRKVIYSKEGQSSERELIGPDDLSMWLEKFRRTGNENQQLLSHFVHEYAPKPQRWIIADHNAEDTGLIAQARTVARLRYDLEMVLLK